MQSTENVIRVMQTLNKCQRVSWRAGWTETFKSGSGRGRGKSTVKRQLARNLLYLVIKDQNMDVSRIQVKTASASKLRDGYSAKYSVRFSQLSQPITPEITYIFVTRLNSRWESFLVIPREVLYDQYETYQAGSLTKAGQASFYFNYLNETVTCSKRDFSTYLNNWSAWPVIEHWITLNK